jgi:arylformamidase
MNKIYDISQTLNPSIAVWPGDCKFELSETLKIKSGASVNLSKMTMSIHTGTHVDAPYHFLEHGLTIEGIDLSPFWGPAQVVTIRSGIGPIEVKDFSHVDLRIAPRILVRTNLGEQSDPLFPDSISYPSLELVDYFARHDIILYGVDAPSVDKLDSKTLDVHKTLNFNKINILEGITLQNVPDGIYELVAIPLKIEGADGSPVRAILRPIDK